EHLLHLRDVRDDEDLLEVVLDGLDRLDESFQALSILRAEALVYDEELDLRTGPPRHEFREADAQREVGAERLAAAEQFVVAGAQLVGELDVQRLNRVTLAGVALRLQLEVHAVVSHAGEERVRLLLQLGDHALDEHSLQALFAEGQGQLAVDTALLLQARPLLDQPRALALLELERGQDLLRRADALVAVAPLALQPPQLGIGRAQLALQRGRVADLRAQRRGARLVGHQPRAPALGGGRRAAK